MAHPDATTGDAATHDAASDAGPSLITVPWTTGPIDIDGDLDESDWRDRAYQLIFVDDMGMQARPYSEVRLLRDATKLYIAGYAADDDIESTDFFQLSIATLIARVDPRGHYTASESGIDAAGEYDGTIDDPDDFDEEWIIEVAVPLSLVGLAPGDPQSFSASRCDVTKDDLLHCGDTATTLQVTSLDSGPE